MSFAEMQSFLAVAIGFAVAGLVSSGYQLVAARPATFGMLQKGPSAAALAAVPFLIFAAPFIMMRAIIRGGMQGRQNIEGVMLLTVLVGLWSLMSGTVVVMALQEVARFVG
jgi:hypothetical protein